MEPSLRDWENSVNVVLRDDRIIAAMEPSLRDWENRWPSSCTAPAGCAAMEPSLRDWENLEHPQDSEQGVQGCNGAQS